MICSSSPSSPEIPDRQGEHPKTSRRRFFVSGSALFSPKAHLRLWLIAGAGLVADLLTKSWALRVIGNPDEVGHFSDLNPIAIIGDSVQFITVLNSGASWGIAAGKTSLLLAGSAIALVFMFWLFASLHSRQWVAQTALGMLLGGALGNTYDRIFNGGKVIDFISVDLNFWPANPWPAFNIADSLLCVGVGILLISMLFHKKRVE